MWYLCGLGSNLSPEVNLGQAITLLVGTTGWIWVSRVLRSDPVGMESENSFLNALVVFWSALDPDRLKIRLNGMEEKLGRDRDDPRRKLKDHAIDIDILEFALFPRFEGRTISEPYFRKLFEDDYAPDDELVSLVLGGHEFGKEPTVIFNASGEGGGFVVRPSSMPFYPK